MSKSRQGGRAAPRARREVSAGGVVVRRAPDGSVRYLLIRDGYGHWGLPKGHLEDGETAEQAALRETSEETGLESLQSHGPVATIDWYFRLRGRLIHKFCHFFLLESPHGQPVPQQDEGISECQWFGLDEALERVDYANAREVLRRAGDLASALAA